MRLLPIIQYMQSNKSVLQDVQPSERMTPLDDFVAEELPVAYLHPVRDKSLPNQLLGALSQDRESYFAVVTVARELDIINQTEQLADARDENDSLLLGYQQDIQHDHIQHVEGEILDIKNGLIAYQDVYRTAVIKSG